MMFVRTFPLLALGAALASGWWAWALWGAYYMGSLAFACLCIASFPTALFVILTIFVDLIPEDEEEEPCPNTPSTVEPTAGPR